MGGIITVGIFHRWNFPGGTFLGRIFLNFFFSRPKTTLPESTRPRRFLTTYISKNKLCDFFFKIWENAHHSKLQHIMFSKRSTEASNHEVYSNTQFFWHFWKNLFSVCISEKLLKLRIWNKRQKLHTFLTYNPYYFQTNHFIVASVSFIQVKVK